MANISAIKLPNGVTYNLKDSVSGYITLPDLPVYDGTVVEDGDGFTTTPLYVTESYDDLNEKYVLNKTAGEIYDAWRVGRQIWIIPSGHSQAYLVDEIEADNSDAYLFACSTYMLRAISGYSPSYSAVSASEYPYSSIILN